ncbi:hypothetical protein QP572_08000 [Brevibacterium sp. UMB10442]|nr:hypothetical protein [Brevibacterium sp. UMB10442]
MKKRLVLLAGIGIGFVLGSRAGRQSYENLKRQATNLWNDPKVQDGIDTAREQIEEKAPVVAQAVKDKAPVVVDKVKEAADAGVAKAKEATSDVKAKVENDPKADVPDDVVSDPATPMDEEGPAPTK